MRISIFSKYVPGEALFEVILIILLHVPGVQQTKQHGDIISILFSMFHISVQSKCGFVEITLKCIRSYLNATTFSEKVVTGFRYSALTLISKSVGDNGFNMTSQE